MRNRTKPLRFLGIVSLLLILGVLVFVMAKNLLTSEKGGSESQANSDALFEYRYSFDAGRLVLRTKNYSDIISADSIPENERQDYGFWFEENSSNYVQIDGMVFRIENSSKNIVRYTSRGVSQCLVESEGDLKFFRSENGCLYFYCRNSDKHDESFWKINNCASDDYSIECIAEISCASHIDNNYGNAVFKYGEWIYFLYTDDPQITWELGSPRLWLYRLSEKTGIIERVDSVYNECIPICRKITDLQEYDGYYILEGISWDETVHNKRCIYLYDPTKDSCVLICTTNYGGSEIAISDEVCYHFHQNTDETVSLARTSIHGPEECEIVYNIENEQYSHSATLGMLNIWENTLVYSATSGDVYNQYPTYCLNLAGESPIIRIQSTQFLPDVYFYDGIIYMFLNGSVIYSNVEHPEKWYDSGIRFSKKVFLYWPYCDYTFFSEANGSIYFITCDYRLLNTIQRKGEESSVLLNDCYDCREVIVDYSKEITADSPIFQPIIDELQPSILNGGYPLVYSATDIWGNSFGNPYYTEENSLGLAFIPTIDNPQSVQYDTAGRYRYMSGVIGVNDISSGLNSAQIRFYADGSLIYETPILTRNSAPIEFKLDIRKADTITVEAISDDGRVSDISVTFVSLVIDLVAFHNHDMPPIAKYWFDESFNEGT